MAFDSVVHWLLCASWVFVPCLEVNFYIVVRMCKRLEGRICKDNILEEECDQFWCFGGRGRGVGRS